MVIAQVSGLVILLAGMQTLVVIIMGLWVRDLRQRLAQQQDWWCILNREFDQIAERVARLRLTAEIFEPPSQEEIDAVEISLLRILDDLIRVESGNTTGASTRACD